MTWVIGLDFREAPGLPVWAADYGSELACTDDGWLLRLLKEVDGDAKGSPMGDAHTVTASTCTCGHHMWRDAQCKHMLLWGIIRRKLGMSTDIAP